MTKERAEELFDTIDYDLNENSEIFKGLLIIRKYIPNADISAAEHDEVHAADLDELIKKDITEEDISELSRLGWIVDDETDSVYHFV